ncbi:MAG: Vitamin B12 transporter BtuB [Ignavibacteria bacterium]|nr:Vitamin B12 transporter BtuB [Ignavibacteria bacterium]
MTIKIYKSVLLILLSAVYARELYPQVSDTTEYLTPEIEVHSNKFSGSIFTAPVKIQLIDKEAINNKNGNSLADILQTAGGIFIKDYGGSGSLNTISMNGLGAEHTLVLLNGMTLNSPQNALTDLSLISKDNIKSIEILNNGSSAVYGSNAIGGVVNIRTDKASGNKLRVNLNGQAGSYSQKKINFGLSKPFGRFYFTASVSNETSDNDFNYFYFNGISDELKNRKNSAYNISHYNVQIEFRGRKDAELNFYSEYTNSRREIPGIETGNEPSNAVQNDYNWNNIFSYSDNFSDKIKFKSQLNFRNDYQKYYDKILTDSYYRNSYLGNLSQVQIKAGEAELITGFEIGYSGINSNEVSPPSGRFQGSIFLLSNLSMLNKLTFYPSVRFEHYSDINENIITGKAGINYKPFIGTNLHFKFSAGNNFSSPTFNELYWENAGSRDLKPEKSLNADAGFIYELPGKKTGIIELTYTYIDAKDKIVWMPNSSGLWKPENIGKSVSNVFTADFQSKKFMLGEFNFKSDIKYSFTSSLKRSEDFPGDPSYDKMIIYIPQHLFKVSFNAEYHNSGLNLFYNYTGERYTDAENTQLMPSINIIDGNIYQSFSIYKINVLVKFEVNNIFNLNYQVMPGYPMPLRNYKLNLNLEI